MDREKRTGEISPAAAVVGSTGGGKSALALAICERHGGELVSVDSMQVYRTMDIGTAKPTREEQARVRHHMIDVCAPDTPYSAADYAPAALAAAREIAGRGNLPVFCGGTGLYLDSVLRGGAPEETASDAAVREALQAELAAVGAHALHEHLRAVDPESADVIHENNTRRVIRALEVYEVSGKPKSVWDRESRAALPALPLVAVGLYYHDRDLLYKRIDRRVDEMLRAGLLDETERLWRAGVFEKNTTAAAAIGYKELLGVLTGKESLADATARLKTATRRYAKRQITWFSAKPYVLPLYCDSEDGTPKLQSALVAEVEALLREGGVRV